MKKAIKLSVLVVLLGIILTSCKKYPEGPSFSLRSKKARVANTWQIENVKENGTDVTSFYTAFAPGYTLTLDKDGNYNSSTNSGEVDKGTWDFDGSKENLVMTSTKNTGSTTTVTTSKILKLENDAMWLSTTDNSGDVTEIHYISK